jgi:hypothetical protein
MAWAWAWISNCLARAQLESTPQPPSKNATALVMTKVLPQTTINTTTVTMASERRELLCIT